MASFGAKDIKKLREMTGAGMMDCKKALTATDGDIEKAIEWLRKKGLGAAAKKADKVATEGSITMKIESHKGMMIEINSQTDFVAKNDKFQNFASEVIEHAFNSGFVTVEEILESQYNGENFKRVPSYSNIKGLEENLVVRRVAVIEADSDQYYNKPVMYMLEGELEY